MVNLLDPSLDEEIEYEAACELLKETLKKHDECESLKDILQDFSSQN
jgi:hypothetical protein